MAPTFDELRVYALYGPGTALSWRGKRSGAFTYSMQGNVEPLFPRLEMGFYAGTDVPGMEAIFREADRGLPGAASNPRPAPDAAFVSVKSTRSSDWTFDLYNIPAPARPFLDALFQWVEGPGRASRERAVEVVAALSGPSAREFQPIGCTLSLKNPAPQPAVISSPRGETLEIVFADDSQFADPERYEVFAGDGLRVAGIPPSVVTGTTSSIAPGTQLDVSVEAVHGLARGTYRGTILYRSFGADLESSGGRGLAGAVRLDLGRIRVTP